MTTGSSNREAAAIAASLTAAEREALKLMPINFLETDQYLLYSKYRTEIVKLEQLHLIRPTLTRYKLVGLGHTVLRKLETEQAKPSVITAAESELTVIKPSEWYRVANSVLCGECEVRWRGVSHPISLIEFHNPVLSDWRWDYKATDINKNVFGINEDDELVIRWLPAPVATVAEATAKPEAAESGAELFVIKRLKELKHEYKTGNLTEYGKGNLVAVAGEMLLLGTRSLDSLIDLQSEHSRLRSELAASQARVAAVEAVVNAASKVADNTIGDDYGDFVAQSDDIDDLIHVVLHFKTAEALAAKDTTK